MIGRLGTDLTEVEAVVCGTDVLYDETPLARPLIVVDADTRVTDEWKQTDSQWMNVVMTTPRDLQHVMCRVVLREGGLRNQTPRNGDFLA